MARLAERVGVSRQTVYNEIGTKPALAEAMILAELDRFLGGRRVRLRPAPRRPARGDPRGRGRVLELAQDNRLLHAVVSATHGADTELLPLLTTHAESLLAAAKVVVAERVAPYDVPLDAEHLEAAIDMVVRVVLSHVMQPSGTPAGPPPTSPGSPPASCADPRRLGGSSSTSAPPVIRMGYADRSRGRRGGRALGSGMTFLDGTVVNVALRTIGEDLDATLAELQWITNGYLLSLAS